MERAHPESSGARKKAQQEQVPIQWIDGGGWPKEARMTWFKREDNEFVNDRRKTVRTEGLWIQCGSCRQAIFKKDLEENLNVCPKCGTSLPHQCAQRIELLLEPGYELVDMELRSTDPLDFTDLKRYQHRLAEARKKTGLNDAIVTALGMMGPHDVVLSAMEYGFIGGSMGAVVGETIARAIDRSLATRHPLIIVAASGGARMMEGIVSLMQLAKIARDWRGWTTRGFRIFR